MYKAAIMLIIILFITLSGIDFVLTIFGWTLGADTFNDVQDDFHTLVLFIILGYLAQNQK